MRRPIFQTFRTVRSNKYWCPLKKKTLPFLKSRRGPTFIAESYSQLFSHNTFCRKSYIFSTLASWNKNRASNVLKAFKTSGRQTADRLTDDWSNKFLLQNLATDLETNAKNCPARYEYKVHRTRYGTKCRWKQTDNFNDSFPTFLVTPKKFLQAKISWDGLITLSVNLSSMISVHNRQQI